MLFMLASCFDSGGEEEGGGGLFSNHVAGENSFFLLPTADAYYNEGQSLDLTLRHSQTITVSGNPRIELDINGTAAYAEYLTGSGTSSIVFRYTIQAGDNDIDGVEIIPGIDLNGGTLTYAVNGIIKDASTDFTQVATNNIYIDTNLPSISSVFPPYPKKYVLGESLQFFVNFNEVVLTEGVPRIALSFDGVTKYAEYISGSNSTTLLFSYKVVTSDLDLNGISASSTIDLNSGRIKDKYGNNAQLTFTPIPMPTTLVDGDIPYVVSVTPPANNTYLAGDMLQMQVEFSEKVVVTGSPRIQINLNADTRHLEYVSGSGTNTLLFEYNISLGESDYNGITLGNMIDLNGGSIEDLSSNLILQNFTAPLTPGILVDAKEPEVESITPPSDGTYYIGQPMFFILTFNREVNVQGSPRLPIILNSNAPTPVYAQYLSGNESDTLIFQYIVQNGDSDPDGIMIVNYFELNGGVVRANNNLDASLDITNPVASIDTSSVIVDAALPMITALTVPADNNYTTGNNLDFVVSFNKNVDVLNTPRLVLDIGGTTRYANYLSGTGTSNITFRYTVIAPDLDPDGITFGNNFIDLNTIGIIRDGQGNNATLELTTYIPNMADIFVNSAPPTIISLIPPANNTYLLNDNIDFVVTTSENVNIVGNPRISINIGGTTKFATYQSGTGTNAITFRYTIETGLYDNDGINITSPIDLNSGTIKNTNLQDLDLSFTPPVLTNVFVNSNVPTITSITPPADATYVETNQLDFIVNTSENINITGFPRIAINIGGTTKYAIYTTGTGTSSLTFRYTIEAGLSDADGISISSPIDLNSGTMQNGSLDNLALNFTPPSMPSVLVDSADPTVAIVIPANNSYINANTDSAAFTISGTCSEVGQTVTVKVDGGAASSPVGFVCDGTNFSGTIDTTGLSEAAHILYAEIQDVALNTGTSTTVNITRDVTAPQISSITPPANGIITTGNDINLVVNYNESINITNTPRIQLNIGGSTLFAEYNSGSGSSSITFKYTVATPDADGDGIEIGNSSIDLNTTGLIEDIAGNTAPVDISLFLPDLSGVYINISPVTISSITPPADATYYENDNLDFIINISENVDVVGTPRIAIDIGGTTKYAVYNSGTGTNALTFRYTVETNLLDTNGITISSPLDFNSGTIKNSSLLDLDPIFTSPAMASVLVDSILPTITSITPPADGTYVETNNLDFIINIDENVNVTGVPRIQLDIGGTIKYADYVSGTGTNALIFRYTVEAGLNDTDGITASSPMTLNGGTIRNGGLQNLDLSFTPPTMTNILVDSQVPTITSVIPPTDNTYIETDDLDFIINISEIVNVTGIPRIQLDIGGTIKYADYVSGSGSNALIFRYTVESNLSDNNGIGLSSPLNLNSGTIKNASLEDLDLTFTPPSLTNVLVDSTNPTVAITNPTDGSYINASNDSATFTISGTCSEAGQIVTIEVDAGPAPSPAGFACNGSNFTGTIDTIGLTPGAHTLIAKIQDAALNEGVSTTINTTKDAVAPTITSVNVPIPNNYIVGNNLNFVVNLDEVTNVTGNPRLQIDIGGSTRYATYFSGTGTTSLTFRYTIQNGDYDTNGLGFISSLIDLNTGNLVDAASNTINLDMEATVSLPSLTSINVYGILPTVSITSAPDITAANQAAYTVSGACDQEGRTVSVNIDGLIFSPICSSSAWTTGAVNVTSRLDNVALPITADLDDAAGNNAIQATASVNKDTATPTVTISFSPDITSANHTNYAVSGTCTNVGQVVDVNFSDGVNPAVNVQPNCAGGSWTSGAQDVSSLNDGTITITADHLTASTASVNVNKDTSASIIVISSAPNINGGNETSYIVSGICSDNGVMVDVNIDDGVNPIINIQPNCNSGSWTTGLQNVSSLNDGSIIITADHATASQATANITKNTSTPTISTLSIPITLKDSIDLNWSLNDPGGFTINDYQIQYRIKGTGTWLPFNDGVSINTYSTITGLTASTTYEVRVRVQYDTSNYSDWSTIAEGTTKPDDPLFSSPYLVMNVGGATDTKVVALYDSTEVFHNGISIGTINSGQTLVVPGGTARFDTIDADKPIYTAGNLGGTNTGAGAANIVWQPTSWAGTSFSFNAIRSDPQSVHVYAVENATVTVKNGSTVLAGPTVVSAGTGATLQWNAYGSFQVVATDLILAFHTSRNTLTEDPKPLLPSSNEIIGFPSNSMRLTADVDATNFTGFHSDDTFESGNLNKPDVIQINPTGGTTTLYQSNSLIISADQKVAGASFADSNGNCAAPFLPTNMMKKKYMINVVSNWVAFASKLPGTIEVYSPGQIIGVDTPVDTLTLSRSGTNTNSPYSARRGATPEGYRFISNVPMAGWYQPDTTNQAGRNDETILYGTDD